MTSQSIPDHRLALAALTLSTSAPRGPEPDVYELDEWRLGTVPEPRASEIVSHIAASAELAVMVAELERVATGEMEEESGDEGSSGGPTESVERAENVVPLTSRASASPKRPWYSRRPGAFFGSALAACLAMVLIWPQPQQSDWPSGEYGWLDERSDHWMSGDPALSTFPQFRSKSIGEPDDDTIAVRSGARWVALTVAMGDANWEAWAGSGPTVVDLCGRTECEPRETLMMSTGRWLFQVYTECSRQNNAMESELAVLERVVTLGDDFDSPVINRLSTARGKVSELCKVSGDVLGLS